MLLLRVVARRFVPRLAGWQFAMVLVYAVADATDLASRSVPWALYPLRLAAMVFQSLPLALAAAVAHTLSSMRQNGEWLGARAAGMSVGRLAVPMILVALGCSVMAFGIGDRIAPACARAFRAAGGGAPPGAVAMPQPSAAWRRSDGGLVRAGDPTLEIRFGGDRPRILVHPRSAAGQSLPLPSDLEWSRLQAAVRHASDALPYELEASFRVLTSACSLLLPLLALALLGWRDASPRMTALICGLGCLASYAIVALSYDLALVGLVSPAASAAGAGVVLALAVGTGALGLRTRRTG